jgi:O-acetyl-ADP-ribose deacetylase (regulator of RNase III)
MGYVSQWGGMSVGSGMMFPANTVDGLVHQLGGKQLLKVCQDTIRQQPSMTTIIPEGQAVYTPAVGNLSTETQYNHIIHCVPPFYDKENNATNKDVSSSILLADTYRNSLHAVSTIVRQEQGNNNSTIRVACPLLGAGCRGFPVEEAIEVAAKTLFSDGNEQEQQSDDKEGTDIVLAFGVPSGEIRNQMVGAFNMEQQSRDGEENVEL